SFRNIAVFNCLSVIAGGHYSRLVSNVCQVSSAATGSFPCQNIQIHALFSRLILEVDLQNSFTVLPVRQGNVHPPVETARPKKCWIQYIRTVRGGQDNHVCSRFK